MYIKIEFSDYISQKSIFGTKLRKIYEPLSVFPIFFTQSPKNPQKDTLQSLNNRNSVA